MDNPNILFTRKDTAELVGHPVPEPSAGEVRVRLARSCISSGTERANLIGVPDRGVGIFATGDGVTWPRSSWEMKPFVSSARSASSCWVRPFCLRRSFRRVPTCVMTVSASMVFPIWRSFAGALDSKLRIHFY